MNDTNGDDLSIEDNEGLLRRVPNHPNMVKFDSNINAYRPSSVCFCDRETQDREVSITLEKPLKEDGHSEEFAINDFPGFGVARVLANVVRHEVNPKQLISRKPTESDPYHGLVVGDKTRATKKAIAKRATLLINPDIQNNEVKQGD